MKQFILALLLLVSLGVSAQKTTKDANGNYVAVKSTPMSDSSSLKPTGKTYTDTKGKVYPVFLTSTGRPVAILTSKKTGNKYKKYL